MALLKNTMKASKIVKQAIKIQGELRKLKKAMATEEFNGTSNNGNVTVTVNGNHRIVNIIPGSAEAQGVMEAANAAIHSAEESFKARTKEVTKGTAVAELYDEI